MENSVFYSIRTYKVKKYTRITYTSDTLSYNSPRQTQPIKPHSRMIFQITQRFFYKYIHGVYITRTYTRSTFSRNGNNNFIFFSLPIFIFIPHRRAVLVSFDFTRSSIKKKKIYSYTHNMCASE